MDSTNQQTQRSTQPRRTCSKNGQLVVGILLIISSSLTIIFGIVAVSLPTIYYAYGGNPLWTGVIILIGGILCAYSHKSVNKCLATGGLVMNIISIIFAIDQILWMSVSVAREESYNEHCSYYYEYYNNYYNYWNSYYKSDCDVEIAIDSVLIALGVFELAFAIAAVCVLSMDVCCGPTYQQQTMGVMYQARQPVVIQGGYVQNVAPFYPPQTQIVNPPGQVMYIQQQVPQYPTVGPSPYPASVPGQYTGQQPQQPAGKQEYHNNPIKEV